MRGMSPGWWIPPRVGGDFSFAQGNPTRLVRQLSSCDQCD